MKKVRGSSQKKKDRGTYNCIGQDQSGGLAGPPALTLPWTSLVLLHGRAESCSLAATPTPSLPAQAGGNGCVSRRPSTSSLSTIPRGRRHSASARGSRLSWLLCTARQSWTSWGTTCRRWAREGAWGCGRGGQAQEHERETLPTLPCSPGFPSSPGARSSTGGLACTPRRVMDASGRSPGGGESRCGRGCMPGCLAPTPSCRSGGCTAHTD